MRSRPTDRRPHVPSPHVQPDCVIELEHAMAQEVDHPRFVPFVMLHEFETLVFAAALHSDPMATGGGVGAKLRAHAAGVSNQVELIDDSPATAPSKRVLSCWPEYNKVLDGVSFVGDCDFQRVLDSCPHLASWVARLRTLG